MSQVKQGAILIESDGTVTPFFPGNRHHLTLTEAQRLVGGYIEVVQMPADNILIVNENGKLEGLPYNLAATELARSCYAIADSDYIVGDAVICPRKMLP